MRPDLKRIGPVVVAAIVAATFAVFFYGKALNRETADMAFKELVDHSLMSFRGRTSAYQRQLNAAAAFYVASTTVSAQDWRDFVLELDLSNTAPGILGVGLILPVDVGDEGRFLRSAAQTGTRDIVIRPETTYEDRFVVRFIEPAEINRGVVGFDPGHDPARRSMFEAARDEGQVRITQRIQLVQDEGERPGFLMLRPVFETTEADGRVFRGWVYSPMISHDFIADPSGAEAELYALTVYEGDAASPDAVIYGSGPAADGAGRSVIRNVDVFGRDWLFRWDSTAAFDAANTRIGPYAAVAVGLVSAILVAMLLRSHAQRGAVSAELAQVKSRQLAVSEAQNRSLLQNSVSAMLLADGDRRIVSANPAAAALFESDGEDFVGRHLSDYFDRVPGEGGKRIGNAVGRTATGESRYLYVEENGWAMIDGQNRMVAIIHDVTSEVTHAEDVARMKERFDRALEGVKIAVFEVDFEAGTSVVSDTWLRIMGYWPRPDAFDPQEAFKRRVHPDDLPLVERADADCLAGRTPRSTTEFRVSWGEAGWRWMRSDAVVIARDGAGKATQLLGVQSDITALRAAQDQLEASEARFRQVLADAPVGMAVISQNSAIIEANDAARAYFGAAFSAEASALHLEEVFHPDDLEPFLNGFESLRRDETRIYQSEHRFVTHGGRTKWGLLSISKMRGGASGQAIFIAQIQDIDDIKNVERIKSEFVATVSHELRTPLTSIKGALSLLRGGCGSDMPAPHLRMLEIAATNTDRLEQLVNDILDLEKISSEEIPFEIETLDLRDVLDGAADLMAPFAAQHGVTIDLTCTTGQVMIVADARRTQQVVTNLLSNACKYSFDATEVAIWIEVVDRSAVVFVQNLGPGVPEHFRDRIFQPFSQADGSDTRAVGGTGLGLNISKQIVERHGGRIGYESIADRFTIFWFSCRLARTGRGGNPHVVVDNSAASGYRGSAQAAGDDAAGRMHARAGDTG